MNKVANSVILIYFQFIQMPTIETKFCIFCIQTLCNAILSWMSEIWMKNCFVSDNNCNIMNLQCPKYQHINSISCYD